MKETGTNGHTYFDRVRDADAEVIGSTPIPVYPRAGVPGDPTGPEPPLGIDVNALPALGGAGGQ